LLNNRGVALHTDGAQSYKDPERYLRRGLHDYTKHSSTLVNGVQVRPKFVELWEHTVGMGIVVRCKSGTQIIDRFW